MEPVQADALEVSVEDLFRIAGRGVVVVGVVRTGQMTVGQTVTITRPDGKALVTRVRAIELHGPPNLPNGLGFLLGEEADDFLMVGAVIRS